MSADNFLGVRRTSSRKFVGYDCWFECERDCANCSQVPIFTTKSLSEAMSKAQDETQNDIYEYGIRVLGKV